ncbi:hypothetical protein U1Q18_015378, partial [Sarracenia purpurea var. burkii]
PSRTLAVASLTELCVVIFFIIVVRRSLKSSSRVQIASTSHRRLVESRSSSRRRRVEFRSRLGFVFWFVFITSNPDRDLSRTHHAERSLSIPLHRLLPIDLLPLPIVVPVNRRRSGTKTSFQLQFAGVGKFAGVDWRN